MSTVELEPPAASESLHDAQPPAVRLYDTCVSQMWGVAGQSRVMHRDRYIRFHENGPDLDRVRWRAARVRDSIGDQFAGDQEGVIVRRAEFLDLAERRPSDGGGFAAAPNLQHQQLTARRWRGIGGDDGEV
jgi:hypothetical protein